MAHYTSSLSFVLVFVVFSLVKIEARESKFFTKSVVNNTAKNVTHRVDPPSPSPSQSPSSSPSPAPAPPSPSPSSSPSPAPAPVKAEMNRGYGLYGRDEIPNISDTLFENNIPTQDKFGKDEFDNNGLASNYNQNENENENENSYVQEEKLDNEEFGLPSNYNKRSYMTVPRGDKKEDFGLSGHYNERSYVTVPQGNNKEDFGLPSNYNERSYVKVSYGDNKEDFGLPSNYNERSYVTVSHGDNNEDFGLPRNYNGSPLENKFTSTSTNEFDDTLTPEEEKLFNHKSYNVKEPQGMSDTRTLDNTQGYYVKDGDPQSKYEFDTMEEYEKQQGYSQIPGEYINP